MAEAKCPCGQPLHYSKPHFKFFVNAMVERLGEHVTVTDHEGTAYAVSRHYIALHGIREQDLAALAAQGIIQRIP